MYHFPNVYVPLIFSTMFIVYIYSPMVSLKNKLPFNPYSIGDKINDLSFIWIDRGSWWTLYDENIIYCLYYDKFPITGGTNPGVYYLSSVMVFSDGFSDTQNKLDPNWSINYLLLQNIVTATEIHNGRKNYFLMSEEYKSLKETRNASPPNGKICYFYFVAVDVESYL